jgi:cathepsin X
MCEAIDVCRDCVPPKDYWTKPELSDCTGVSHEPYYVSEYYKLSGVDQMKAEIYKNGPISCGIHVTDNFENYDGTYIYKESVKFPISNHEISVTGFGKTEDGEEYWIGRNSWGTYWGDYGFFYISMDGDNLGITRDCIAGTPSYTKPEADTFAETFIQ